MSARLDSAPYLSADDYLRLERRAESKRFHLYRFLDSLREYILVRQDRAEVEIFRKEEDERWSSVQYNELSDEFDIRSVGVRLSLSHIYERVIPAAVP